MKFSEFLVLEASKTVHLHSKKLNIIQSFTDGDKRDLIVDPVENLFNAHFSKFGESVLIHGPYARHTGPSLSFDIEWEFVVDEKIDNLLSMFDGDKSMLAGRIEKMRKKEEEEKKEFFSCLEKFCADLKTANSPKPLKFLDIAYLPVNANSPSMQLTTDFKSSMVNQERSYGGITIAFTIDDALMESARGNKKEYQSDWAAEYYDSRQLYRLHDMIFNFADSTGGLVKVNVSDDDDGGEHIGAQSLSQTYHDGNAWTVHLKIARLVGSNRNFISDLYAGDDDENAEQLKQFEKSRTPSEGAILAKREKGFRLVKGLVKLLMKETKNPKLVAIGFYKHLSDEYPYAEHVHMTPEEFLNVNLDFVSATNSKFSLYFKGHK